MADQKVVDIAPNGRVSLTSPYSGKEKSDSFSEKPDHGTGESAQLQRRLKSRHLQMIAIGGTIGTGLFIGSGGALAKSGPAGALIAYTFVGTLVYRYARF